jgi:hypothetical protein
MKKVLVFIGAIFILSACGGEDPVAASHDKMMYDYSDPSVMDDNEIILPETTVIVQGEVVGIDEAVSNIFASRISSEEDKEYESVTFEEMNVLRIESEDGEGYIVLTDDLGSWNEGDLITITGTFEGMNNRTFFPLIKAESIEELTND